MRWATAVLMLAIAGGSCAPGSPGVRERRTDVYVADAGSTITRGGKIGIAALFRNRTDEVVGPIEIRVRFRDRRGEVVDTTVDSLPYCVPGDDCYYGGTFSVGAEVREADIVVEKEPPAYREAGRTSPFTVGRREDGQVYGRAPAHEGYAYVIAFVDGRPKWGTFRSIDARDNRMIVFAPADVPRLKDSELRGYFYSARVPAGE